MDTNQKPVSKAKPDGKSAAIGLAAFSLGSLGLIPALLALFVVGSIAFIGLRFLWGLIKLFAS
jgi:hypothetical protein